MSTARGSQHAAYRALETEYGALPTTPTFLQFRQAGFKGRVNKATIVSKEILSTRHVADTRFGANSVAIDVSAELSYGSHDDLLEAALMGTWAPVATKTAITLAFVADGNQITDSGNGLVTAGFAVGQRVRTTGAGTSANNAVRTITAVADGALTFAGVDGNTIVDEAAGGSVTVRTLADKLTVGSTVRSMIIESHFTDLGEFMRYTGMKIAKVGFKTAPNGTVDLTFTFMGQDGVRLSIATDKVAGATYTAPTNTPIMVSSRAVITEDEAVTASLSELSFDLDNGMEEEPAIGVSVTGEPCEGDSNVTGSLTAYFRDTALLAKWLDEEEDSLSATYADAAGNAIRVDIPRIAITGAAPEVTGKGGIPITVPFQALLDSVSGTNMTITRTPIA